MLFGYQIISSVARKFRVWCVAASVPIPKFVTPCSRLRTNFGIEKDTSKLMFLVWFSDLKFASGFTANDVANFKSTTLGRKSSCRSPQSRDRGASVASSP